MKSHDKHNEAKKHFKYLGGHKYLEKQMVFKNKPAFFEYIYIKMI